MWISIQLFVTGHTGEVRSRRNPETLLPTAQEMMTSR